MTREVSERVSATKGHTRACNERRVPVRYHRDATEELDRRATSLVVVGTARSRPTKDDFKPFDEVSKGYEKVVSTADGKHLALHHLARTRRRARCWPSCRAAGSGQKHFIAVTQASGGVFAGLQGPDLYVYWKQYDERLALIEPKLETRSHGEAESKSSVERLFTDRVLLDVPIVAMGPSGQPVIDLDELLRRQGRDAHRWRPRHERRQSNARLADGHQGQGVPGERRDGDRGCRARRPAQTLHYSISTSPSSTGYKPREADERVGYFTTVYRDLGQYDDGEEVGALHQPLAPGEARSQARS